MQNNSLSRVLWKVSIPIIFVEATETLDHLIDSVFLAHVGVTELGAIGVADAVMLLFLVPALCLVDGIQILTARRVGQRRPDAVGAVFDQGLLLVLLASALSMVALKLSAPAVATWCVESDAVGDAVDGYLQLDAYSIPLAGVAFAYSALLTSLGRTRALIPATIVLVTVDVVLNYLFVFGSFGCPELGIRGAAVGSIGAELAACVFLTVYVRRHIGVHKHGLFRFRGFDRRTTALLGRLSVPIGAQSLVEDVRWFAFFLIVERIGTEALAVANVVFTCYSVFWIPTEGFAETTCSMVGRYAGRDRGHRIGQVLRSTTRGALLATLPFVLLALAAPDWLLGMFPSGAGMPGQGSAGLRVVAMAMLVAIPAAMWYSAVVGTGDTAAALGIESLLTLVMVGATWIASSWLGWPMDFVWLAVPITSVVGLVVSYGWMRSGIWRRLQF